MHGMPNPVPAAAAGPTTHDRFARAPDPRRAPAGLLARAARPRVVFALAASLLVFNLVDALCTLGVVHVGAATEANPLMDLLLRGGPLTFMVGKLALVSLGVALLWRLRQHRAAVAGLAAATTIYALLCIYHIRSVHAVAGYLAASGTP